MAVISGGNVIEGSGLDAPLLSAGAPVLNVTFVGKAVVGSLLIDTVAGKLYIATVATATTVTWTLVGAQV